MVERFPIPLEAALGRSQVTRTILKESERAFQNAFGINIDFRGQGRVNFVPPQRVKEIDADAFTQEYLLATKLREKGLPLDLAFSLSNMAAYRSTPDGMQLFLSTELFAPLAELDPNKTENQETISHRAIRLFNAISNLVLETLPEEVPVNNQRFLKQLMISEAAQHWKMLTGELERSGNKNQSEVLRDITGELISRLENRDDLTITAYGVRLKLKIDNQAVIPYFGLYQNPIKNILTSYSRRIFINHMLKNAKKYPWFIDLNLQSSPRIDERVKEDIEAMLGGLDILNQPRRIFDHYVGSKIGQEIAQGFESTMEEEEEKRLEDSLGQLSIHGVGHLAEDLPLVTYTGANFQDGDQGQAESTLEEDLSEARSIRPKSKKTTRKKPVDDI